MKHSRAIGRMIRRDLAEDEGVAKLSDGAARLYFHLYPFLDSYGKWSGGPGTIAENIIPLVRFSRRKILSCLVQIEKHTSLAIWTHLERVFVHDLQFSRSQKLREDRMGADTLPDYPGPEHMKTSTSPYSLPEYVPDVVPHEVEVEVKFKNKVEGGSRTGDGGNGLKAIPPSGPDPEAINGIATRDPGSTFTDILQTANPPGKGSTWQKSVPYLRDEVTAGRLSMSAARKGIAALGATEAEQLEAFPGEAIH